VSAEESTPDEGEPDEGELVALAVDEERCIGSGQCEMLEEGTFYVDDDTVIAKVIGTGQLSRQRALVLVDTCPSRAISILDAATGMEEEE